jgi:hypothetical protein
MESFKSYFDLIASFFQSHLVLFGFCALDILLSGIVFVSLSQVKAKMDLSQADDELPKKSFYFRLVVRFLKFFVSALKTPLSNCFTVLKKS